ncbi:thiamine pyrophosphate-dependent dehydrogenase E1 component subunit alpha [Shimazuella alba]|uniref:2-oxoisovalerate dehydrogenase subunit alpha n=1 Tax=Shimazuella alba TaxID=2690964 RepID=A0A6I4VY65_9BACL|nr:thiamine pyrophosphate-dependent dehydrogenase E1 component subunit alpha [Shimazuella alba]MXQ55803.1 thiamine pyrophosphate-dependent dehydrogenase E1 component subunit alpha [Shimazuella alba]
MYRYMLLSRKVDEKMWLLNRAGKIPFVVSCQGQEATQVGTAYALDREKDWLCPYYRDLAMVLLFGQTAKDQMLSAFAKEGDPNSGGRQMPNHFGDRRFRILSGSSPVTTQVLHAAGVAYAGKITGENPVVLTSCGEGSSNQGDWHEALNFAGVHKLPVVFLVENNLYAISVPLNKQLAGENVAARGQGYGMPGIRVDGNDVFEVYEVMKQAVERARKGEGPTLIEAVSYRLTPHSSDDDDLAYRTREEVEEAKQKDGLFVLEKYIDEHELWTDEIKEAMKQEIDTEITEAIKFAEAAPHPDPADLSKHVFAR